jgi:hypothetical protein
VSRFIELLVTRDRNILLGQENQKRATILSEASIDRKTEGDSVRRHPGKHMRSLGHNIVGE